MVIELEDEDDLYHCDIGLHAMESNEDVRLHIGSGRRSLMQGCRA
jgi:hypothetical protein